MVYFLISLVFFVSQSFAAVVPSGVPTKCYGGNLLCVPNTDTTNCSIYITLEPCTNHGLTGPCAEAILQLKPKRVIIGTLDPDIINKGKGMQFLIGNNKLK